MVNTRHKFGILLVLLCSIGANACAQDDALQFSTYLTARSVQNFFADVEQGVDPEALLAQFEIRKVILEVYRGGVVVEQTQLERVRDYFLDKGYTVLGGIATVPGGEFGVRQDGRYGWLNWQNEKTQRDLASVMETAAQVFDEFVVDDFLCTDDRSAESDAARGSRSWGAYRRDLMVELSERLFIQPFRRAGGDKKVIVKYPQWYDRFHLFGYDVPRQSEVYDGVWVGTETRGARTQRFGFVQPYEGFVNYRWIASIAGDKISGAWFDHGDCDGIDFLEQAYQTVLAGAPEITLFNYGNLVQGHDGHALLKEHLPKLRKLAAAVRKNPVTGIPAYKPPNSDAGGDLYILDFLGMLGVPVVPVSKFPRDAPVIFLSTQAAADGTINAKLDEAVSNGVTVILSAGFLAKSGWTPAGAGLRGPIRSNPVRAENLIVAGKTEPVLYGLDLESRLMAEGATILLEATVDGEAVPFLTRYDAAQGTVYVLNTHTYSQADFDAVGEVLLSPRALGLLEIPQAWAEVLRGSFLSPLGLGLKAPARVCLQPLGESGWFLHNYTLEDVTVELVFQASEDFQLVDGFTGRQIAHDGNSFRISIPPRSRAWIERRI